LKNIKKNVMNAIPGLTQVKNIPVPTDPINDGRLPQELFEIIQIPPDRHPFKYENLWETELCDFFEDCNECRIKNFTLIFF
jgi:hypothetical protein